MRAAEVYRAQAARSGPGGSGGARGAPTAAARSGHGDSRAAFLCFGPLNVGLPLPCQAG